MGLKALPCLFAYKIWIDSDFHNTRRSLPRWPATIQQVTEHSLASTGYPVQGYPNQGPMYPSVPPHPSADKYAPPPQSEAPPTTVVITQHVIQLFFLLFFWPVYKNDAEVLKLQESSLNLAMADFTHVSCQQWFLRNFISGEKHGCIIICLLNKFSTYIS